MMSDRKYYCYLAFLWGLIANLNQLYGQQLARRPDRQNYISAAEIRLEPTVKWKFQTKGQIFASPIVFKGKVIVGSCDSNLYALDKTSGKIIWKYKTGGEIRSTAAIDSDLLYFVCSDGLLYALSIETGERRWTFATQGEKNRILGITFIPHQQSAMESYILDPEISIFMRLMARVENFTGNFLLEGLSMLRQHWQRRG